MHVCYEVITELCSVKRGFNTYGKILAMSTCEIQNTNIYPFEIAFSHG